MIRDIDIKHHSTPKIITFFWFMDQSRRKYLVDKNHDWYNDYIQEPMSKLEMLNNNGELIDKFRPILLNYCKFADGFMGDIKVKTETLEINGNLCYKFNFNDEPLYVGANGRFTSAVHPGTVYEFLRINDSKDELSGKLETLLEKVNNLL